MSAAALMLFLLAFIVVRNSPSEPDAGESSRIESPVDASRFTVVPTGDPDDPSQLVLPDLIAPTAVGPTVTREGMTLTLIDEEVLRDILEAVTSLSQEELRHRTDTSIVWDDFNNETRRNRIMGRVCSFRGTLRRLEENDALSFPELGIEQLYEGQIQDSMHRWYSFYIVEKPDRPVERHDAAEITGVFYKLITYQRRGGGELVTPLIIGRTLEVERQQFSRGGAISSIARTAPPWLFYGIIAGSAALICIAVHFLFKPSLPGRRRRKRL